MRAQGQELKKKTFLNLYTKKDHSNPGKTMIKSTHVWKKSVETARGGRDMTCSVAHSGNFLSSRGDKNRNVSKPHKDSSPNQCSVLSKH